MSEFALSKNRTHYEKGKVRAWACNPLSGSAESNPVERTAVDWLATIATSEGLARGPHPAAHPLPHSWNQVQPGLLIQVLLGHFVYSISARCHVEHIRKLGHGPCGKPALGGFLGGGAPATHLFAFLMQFAAAALLLQPCWTAQHPNCVACRVH